MLDELLSKWVSISSTDARKLVEQVPIFGTKSDLPVTDPAMYLVANVTRWFSPAIVDILQAQEKYTPLELRVTIRLDTDTSQNEIRAVMEIWQKSEK